MAPRPRMGRARPELATRRHRPAASRRKHADAHAHTHSHTHTQAHNRTAQLGRHVKCPNRGGGKLGRRHGCMRMYVIRPPGPIQTQNGLLNWDLAIFTCCGTYSAMLKRRLVIRVRCQPWKPQICLLHWANRERYGTSSCQIAPGYSQIDGHASRNVGG